MDACTQDFPAAGGNCWTLFAALALKPGSLFVTKKNLYVACKEGFLELLEVVPEGKKKMPAMDFARGSRLVTGDRFD